MPGIQGTQQGVNVTMQATATSQETEQPKAAPVTPVIGKGLKYVVLSAHDYRSPRKANIHFITEQLAQRGEARFFSLRYSFLSRYTNDPRLSLDARANKIETHNGVQCYLWKTAIHPFNTRKPFLRLGEDVLFKLYVASASRVLKDWLASADVVLFESGVAPIFFDLLKKLNPDAKTIYIASDDLETINVAEFVKQTFQRIAPSMTSIRLPSKALANELPSTRNAYFIPHGINHGLAGTGDPSPYGEGVHAVSVGSMLFDADFFIEASRRFPEVYFHIIGCGQPPHPEYGDNVTVYGEMPHDETVRYIKHARFGIAPYRSESVPPYLADTSMKLIQYDFLRLPAVCPAAVTGDYSSRFAYEPGNPESIEAAINKALEAPHESSRRHLNWSEVTDRVLAPSEFDDTRMGI